VSGHNHLTGCRAIITGASQGLGREIARCFLAKGADVAICARTRADIDATAAELQNDFPNRKVVAATCDIADMGDIANFYTITLQALGGFEIVVNNAGIHGPIGATEEVNWSAWQHAIAVNVLGTVNSCRHAVKHLKSRGSAARRGKIINLSGGGATQPQPGLSAYGTAKAAVVRFTETLAAEVERFGIDVYALAPGALATRLMQELKQAGPERIGLDYHARIEELSAKGGMSAQHAAELCAYLASNDSDSFSGRLISAAWDPWPFTDVMKKEIMSSDIYGLRRINPKDRGRNWGDRQ
jgi:3-oxoacyl-[acyl-carrier protein] reductase